MIARSLTAAAVAASILGGCGPGDPPPDARVGPGGAGGRHGDYSQAQMTARPGRIESRLYSNDPVGSGWQVLASLDYAPARQGEVGILSEGVGGACLVVEQETGCSTGADCGRNGYCLDRVRATGQLAGRGKCWAKYSDERNCYKATRDRPLRIGRNAVPNPGPLVLPPRPEGYRVRMITCLNPPYADWPVVDGEKIAPCRRGEGTERVGRPVRVPAA